MSCYSQIPIFRCDKLTLSLFISLSGSQHDLVFGWQTGRLTSYYACFLCHTNTNTYTHTLQHTKSAVTVSDMPDAFSSWRLIIHPHYGGRHSRQVDMHMHTHTCLVLRLCGQLIPRQIRLQTEISSGQPSNHAHTHTRTHTQTYAQPIHSSLEDEGGIYLKPLMVTAKMAETAKAYFLHCVLSKEQMLPYVLKHAHKQTDDTAHREQLNLTSEWARGHTVKAVSKGDQIDHWFQICVTNERRVFFHGWVKKLTLMAWTLTSGAGHRSGCRSAPSTDQAWSNRSRASNFGSGSQPSVWAPHTSW